MNLQTWVDTGSLTTNGNKNPVRPRKILLVDDDADIVSTFKMILEMNNFEVDAYTSPLSALSSFKPDEFGLLILDVRMPVMNGFELFKKMYAIKLTIYLDLLSMGGGIVKDDSNRSSFKALKAFPMN